MWEVFPVRSNVAWRVTVGAELPFLSVYEPPLFMAPSRHHAL